MRVIYQTLLALLIPSPGQNLPYSHPATVPLDESYHLGMLTTPTSWADVLWRNNLERLRAAHGTLQRLIGEMSMLETLARGLDVQEWVTDYYEKQLGGELEHRIGLEHDMAILEAENEHLRSMVLVLIENVTCNGCGSADGGLFTLPCYHIVCGSCFRNELDGRCWCAYSTVAAPAAV